MRSIRTYVWAGRRLRAPTRRIVTRLPEMTTRGLTCGGRYRGSSLLSRKWFRLVVPYSRRDPEKQVVKDQSSRLVSPRYLLLEARRFWSNHRAWMLSVSEGWLLEFLGSMSVLIKALVLCCTCKGPGVEGGWCLQTFAG